MQSDSGKLFIGGISWDTDEERLKEYFSSFGEVIEAVILKDRTTGRARGFGFVVFADPAVAETVITEKHNIDGRLGLPAGFTGGSSFNGSVDYGRGMSPYYIGNTNRFGYEGGSGGGGNSSFFSSNLWGNNGGRSYNNNAANSNSNTYMGGGSTSGNNTLNGPFGNWGAPGGGNSGVGNENLNFGYGGNGESGFGLGGARNIGPPSKAAPSSSFSSASAGYDGAGLAEFYGNGAVYSDPTWRSSAPETEGPASFSYGIGGGGGGPSSDVSARSSSPGYVGSYSVNKRQPNRGIAT
ncbi:hypothetical protein YC2023_038349 [Brassica napus]